MGVGLMTALRRFFALTSRVLLGYVLQWEVADWLQKYRRFVPALLSHHWNIIPYDYLANGKKNPSFSFRFQALGSRRQRLASSYMRQYLIMTCPMRPGAAV